MTITPDELHELARRQSDQPGEAWRRSAISRAYYASYHRCLEWERSLPRRGKGTRRSVGIHQRLIDRLGAPDGACTQHQRDLSIELERLLVQQKKRRVKADYRLPASVDDRDLSEQMKDAREVFRVCAS